MSWFGDSKIGQLPSTPPWRSAMVRLGDHAYAVRADASTSSTELFLDDAFVCAGRIVCGRIEARCDWPEEAFVRLNQWVRRWARMDGVDADQRVHFCDWADHPFIGLSCDRSIKERCEPDIEASNVKDVYRRGDGLLYTFAKELVTCDECGLTAAKVTA